GAAGFGGAGGSGGSFGGTGGAWGAGTRPSGEEVLVRLRPPLHFGSESSAASGPGPSSAFRNAVRSACSSSLSSRGCSSLFPGYGPGGSPPALKNATTSATVRSCAVCMKLGCFASQRKDGVRKAPAMLAGTDEGNRPSSPSLNSPLTLSGSLANPARPLPAPLSPASTNA